MKNAHHITPAEFRIIEILWSSPSHMTVGEVRTQLSVSRSLAYTTVMTLLDNMAKKRSVERVKRGKAYFYRPGVLREKVLDCLISEFARAYFQGSREKLEHFLRATVATPSSRPSEHQELRVELL